MALAFWLSCGRLILMSASAGAGRGVRGPGETLGIVCVTTRHPRDPWLSFEGGALAKTVDRGHVCHYLIRMASIDFKGR